MEKKTIKKKKNISIKKNNLIEKEVHKEDINLKLVEEIELIKKEVEAEKDKYLRLYAEFDNYKKRMSKERIELFSIANIDTITSILPVLDDIEIVRSKIVEEEENKGFFLIMDKLANIMKVKGLEEIEVKRGDKFDVDSHEAITTISTEEEELDGKIYDIISKGYKLNGKLIRHSKVVIAQKK